MTLIVAAEFLNTRLKRDSDENHGKCEFPAKIGIIQESARFFTARALSREPPVGE